jgi:hypothetical protein
MCGVFFAFVSLMQGIEFLLWQHQECDALHKNLSIAGMLLNHLQPVILGLATAWIFQRNVATIAVLLVAYLAVAVPYSLTYLTDENLQCTVKTCGDPHLVWKWNDMSGHARMYAVFIATFICIALVGFNRSRHAAMFSIGTLVTYGLSSLFYERAHVGALWCFWVMLIPPALYALR